MRPAWSIIFFTTLSGLGLGFAMCLGLGLVAPLPQPFGIVPACLLCMGLISGGLVSSLFHLGHPERAWRAMSQWRSSWLSREGVLASLILFLLLIYMVEWWLTKERSPVLGVLVTITAVATVWATAMIYGCLKTVARWHHPLTPYCYLSLAIAGGLLLSACVDQATTQTKTDLIPYVALALVIATSVKIIWWLRAGASGSGSTPETATGLGSLGEVKLMMPPHTEENWLQHEMHFVVARKHTDTLARLALIFGGILPLILLITTSYSVILLLLAVLIHYSGILIERWLFFAEAKHTVTLFYGDRH